MAESLVDGEPYDATNARHVQKRTKAVRSHTRQLDEALRWLMSDRRGRLLMWHRLGQAGVFRSSMAPTPERTAFNEGARNMGLKDLVHIMRVCPDQYGRMAEEARGHEHVDNGESNGERDNGTD